MEALEAMKQNETGICNALLRTLDNLSPVYLDEVECSKVEIFQEFVVLEEKGVKWMYAPGSKTEDDIHSETFYRLYWWNFPDRSNMVTPYGKKSPRVSMLEFILNNR